nr:MAG: hypothetical protein [Bee densovirus 8]
MTIDYNTMDLSNQLQKFAEEFFFLISGKPFQLRDTLQSLVRIFKWQHPKIPPHPLRSKLMEEFPSENFMTFLMNLLEDLQLLLPPLGDQVDAKPSEYQISFPRSNLSSFEKILHEASSNVEMLKQLYKSLESFAVQLPGIGIGQLLVSSPLFHIYRNDLMSTSGMIATPFNQCADVGSSHNSEKRMEMPFLQLEKALETSDLCEASPPKKKKKMEEHTTEICSSKFKFYEKINVY